MRVKIESRKALGKMLVTSAECNTENDVRRIAAMLVSDSEAYVNGLQFVKNGLIELYVYNHTKEVLLYLQGSPEELNAIRNKE